VAAEAVAPEDLVRPWRTATLVASSVAALELVLLLGAGAVLLAKPLSRAIEHKAAAVAAAPKKKRPAPVVHRPAPPPPTRPKLARRQTKVLVLNGNGRSGVAHAAAVRLSSLGYRIAAAGNAKRQDYATTVVMYRPGYRGEGVRLAHDVHAKIVGPLDGLRPAALDGGELALILGAS
jgi:LytR cell envelope-related transcriptional attenuator